MPSFRCIARLEQAAGRKLSDTEVEKIFTAIQKAALDIKAGRKTAAQVSTGRGQAVDDVVRTVATEAAKQYAGEAARAERNVALQTIRLAALRDVIDQAEAKGLTRLDALSRLIANRADGKLDAFSLENAYLGIRDDLGRKVLDTWDALGNDFLGFVQDKEKIALLMREMKGENTGDALAKKGAEAWKRTTEEARKAFNEYGGDIPLLEDWGFPQHHSAERVARAGQLQWIADIMPKLDRTRYTNDAGVPFTDSQMKAFLDKAYTTISSDGFANLEPGQYAGNGSTANRHGESRSIHFKSTADQIAYWSKYGEKTFMQIISGHIDSMAKDIAAVKHLGPNPDTTYRTLRDEALVATGKNDPEALGKAVRKAAFTDALFNEALGRTRPPASRAIGKVFETIRSVNVAAKLGTSMFASLFGDKVTFEVAARLNNISAVKRWQNELQTMNPLAGDFRDALRRQGLMLEHTKVAMARFGQDLGESSFTGKLASAVMRVTGMNAVNDWRRGSFGLSLMDSIGKMVASGKDWNQVHADDMHLLKMYGMTDRDWGIWKLAQLEDFGGGNDHMLTPDAIMAIPDDALRGAGVIGQGDGAAVAQKTRQEAVWRFLGAISTESRYAIVEPGWRERATLFHALGEPAKGTIGGELIRSVLQFKSFPFAQFERSWDMAMSRPGGASKAATLAELVALMTATGAMIMWTRDMLAGKDPRPMDWKFGLAAFMQGGALGIYGDFLYGVSETRQGTGPLEVAAGPTVGPAIDLLTSTTQALKAKTEGKDTHLAAKYASVAKGFVPGSNIWYTKAAFDHLIFMDLQEMLSLGYLANVRSRSIKEYHQDWWWVPGQKTPDRPPNPAAIIP